MTNARGKVVRVDDGRDLAAVACLTLGVRHWRAEECSASHDYVIFSVTGSAAPSQ